MTDNGKLKVMLRIDPGSVEVTNWASNLVPAVRDAQMCDGYLLQNLLLNAYNATALASFTLEGITVL
jgi:hypothetical protein